MWLLLGILLLPLAAQAGPHFVDVTAQAGIELRHIFGSRDKTSVVESHGSGAAFFDYDQDGDLDLYVANGSTFEALASGNGPANAFYRNDGGGTFTETAAVLGVADRSWSAGLAVGDIDNDGAPDLFVANYGANVLYRNRGAVFEADTTAVAGDQCSASAAFFDYDNDGDLDLYVVNYVVFDPQAPDADDRCLYLGGLRVYCGPVGLEGAPDVLYRNDGGHFTDVTGPAGIAAANTYYGLGVVPEDFDRDGDTDLFVANDETPNVLFDNNGDGRFLDVAVQRGVAFNGDGEAESGMGVDAADYDNDGDADLYVTNFYRETNTLYRNEAADLFVDVTPQAGLAGPTLNFLGWGTRFFDYDNDGDLDLFVANGHVYPQVDSTSAGGGYAQTNQLFDNLGDGTFADVSPNAGPGFGICKVSRGSAAGDYDNDGDPDLFVVNLDDTPDLLRNDTPVGNWLMLQLHGVAANRDGAGARIRVQTAAGSQWRTVNGASGYLSHNDLRAHFGLGQATSARVEVHWLGGKVQD